MKKSLFTIFAIVTFVFATSTSFAQLRLGAGLAYGSDIEKLGVQLRGEYGINDKWEAEADFTYFFPEKTEFLGVDISANFSTINLNAHYLLANKDKFQFYPLAGLNIAIASASVAGESESESEFGINAGAGARYSFSEKLNGYADAKYVLGEADQFVINFGVLFNF